MNEALDQCPPEVIQRFFQRADRYASVYSQGATGLLAEYAVKKYQSHQAVSAEDLTRAQEEKERWDSELNHTFYHSL